MEKQAEFVLNDPAYFKFAVARHPWTRIVSGYRSKYVRICKEQRECLEKKFSFPGRPALKSKPISFHEFVETLAMMDARAINEHFRPFHLLCEFGKINYTYIGELDNNPEMDFLSLHIGANITLNNITKPQKHDPNQVRFPCSLRTVQLVEQLYSTDAYVLGYNFTQAYNVCTTYGYTAPPPSGSAVGSQDRKGGDEDEEDEEDDADEEDDQRSRNGDQLRSRSGTSGSAGSSEKASEAHVKAIETTGDVDDDGREVGGEDDDSDQAS